MKKWKAIKGIGMYAVFVVALCWVAQAIAQDMVDRQGCTASVEPTVSLAWIIVGTCGLVLAWLLLTFIMHGTWPE